MCCSALQFEYGSEGSNVSSMFQEVCVLQCVTVCDSVLQFAAVCCSVLQCVVVCCSVLQFAYGLENF